MYILNGDLVITNTPHVRGNVYVPYGAASISNNSNIQGNLWANGSVTWEIDGGGTNLDTLDYSHYTAGAVKLDLTLHTVTTAAAPYAFQNVEKAVEELMKY